MEWNIGGPPEYNVFVSMIYFYLTTLLQIRVLLSNNGKLCNNYDS
jgi:hypothetical protein